MDLGINLVVGLTELAGGLDMVRQGKVSFEDESCILTLATG